MFLEGTLIEKLRKLEALHAGTKVDGEREAARRAAERIRERLAEVRAKEREEAWLYRMDEGWKRKLFVALCRRYGLKPYRERGRRYTTIQVRMPDTFRKQTFEPQFDAIAKEIATEVDALTERVLREAINEDVSDAPEEAAKALPPTK
ncbi:MAG: hypothetical protein M3Y30_05080 [Gemmatimonadota bacterium]|nr:hypothetical protein [Gemmatimonadota bacterium]